MRRSLHRAGGGSRSGGVLETHLKEAFNLIVLSSLQAPLPPAGSFGAFPAGTFLRAAHIPARPRGSQVQGKVMELRAPGVTFSMLDDGQPREGILKLLFKALLGAACAWLWSPSCSSLQSSPLFPVLHRRHLGAVCGTFFMEGRIHWTWSSAAVVSEHPFCEVRRGPALGQLSSALLGPCVSPGRVKVTAGSFPQLHMEAEA